LKNSQQHVIYHTLPSFQSGGSLRRPVNVHFEVFSDELSFYQLGTDVVERYRAEEGMATSGATEPMPTNKVQRAVWILLENPESSLAARIIAILSVSVIVLSIATFCLETLPELKRYHRPAVSAINDTLLQTGWISKRTKWPRHSIGLGVQTSQCCLLNEVTITRLRPSC
jgi:hypothetical protein